MSVELDHNSEVGKEGRGAQVGVALCNHDGMRQRVIVMEEPE